MSNVSPMNVELTEDARNLLETAMGDLSEEGVMVLGSNDLRRIV